MRVRIIRQDWPHDFMWLVGREGMVVQHLKNGWVKVQLTQYVTLPFGPDEVQEIR